MIRVPAQSKGGPQKKYDGRPAKGYRAKWQMPDIDSGNEPSEEKSCEDLLAEDRFTSKYPKRRKARVQLRGGQQVMATNWEP